MIYPISAISIASSGITVTTSPDYLLDGLTAGYVLLTLALAIIAFRSLRQTQASLDLTRQQIELNKQQSKEASEASERHSQATIDVVNKQVEASERQAQEALAEGRRQSEKALTLAHEQIEQGKEPILVPHSPLPLTAVVGELGSTVPELSVDLMNVGTGVALNIWGVIATPERFSRRPFSFSNEAFLLPSEHSTVKLDTHRLDFFAEDYKFGEYNLWPSEELTKLSQGDTGKKLMYAVRLTLTYTDVFGIKHATIFDCTSENKWKFVAHFRIQHDLEDMYKEKKSQS